MDVKQTIHLLQELADIGITEAVIEPVEGGTRVRGSNKNRNTLVFKTLDFDLAEFPIGVQSVRGLLSRINLFDIEKAVISTTHNNRHVQSITIKQGRRKASFRCTDPELAAVPKAVPDCGITDENRITFTPDYVEYLSSAIGAMSFTGINTERSMAAKIQYGEMTVTINDGEDDSFVDSKTMDIVDCRGVWEIAPFEKLMKLSSQYVGGDAEWSISEHGVAVFRIGCLDAMIPPMIS